MGELDDGLPRRHHLSRFGESLDDDPVRIGDQERIIAFVFGHLGLSFHRGELCLCSISSGFDLIVRRSRNGAGADQATITRFVCSGLLRFGFRHFHILCLRGDGMRIVSHIDAHERLAGANRLTDIDESFSHLARNAKSEIALNASSDYARVGAFVLLGGAHYRDPYQVG